MWICKKGDGIETSIVIKSMTKMEQIKKESIKHSFPG